MEEAPLISIPKLYKNRWKLVGMQIPSGLLLFELPEDKPGDGASQPWSLQEVGGAFLSHSRKQIWDNETSVWQGVLPISSLKGSSHNLLLVTDFMRKHQTADQETLYLKKRSFCPYMSASLLCCFSNGPLFLYSRSLPIVQLPVPLNSCCFPFPVSFPTLFSAEVSNLPKQA